MSVIKFIHYTENLTGNLRRPTVPTPLYVVVLSLSFIGNQCLIFTPHNFVECRRIKKR